MKNFSIDQMEFEETSNRDRLFSIIESLLFVAGEAVDIGSIAHCIDCSQEFTQKILEELAKKYHEKISGIKLININNAYTLVTKPENSLYVEKLLGTNLRQSLSQAAIETLAIIAYKQPITRVVIDEIRGVKSDRAINSLIDKKIIKECGRMDAPGRPILYSTTEEFLKYFGLESIKELPGLESFLEEF